MFAVGSKNNYPESAMPMGDPPPMGGESTWFATADSVICPDGALDETKLDDPAGVTITVADATEGQGPYALPSGGVLVVA